MKRILVPVDGSQRSLAAVRQVKTSFSPKVFEIVLLMVRENTNYLPNSDKVKEAKAELEEKLDVIAEGLSDYEVIKKAEVGKAGPKIIECVKENNIDMIVITKSTKTNMVNMIGTTASYIIRRADCNVMVAQEKDLTNPEVYRGMIYKRIESVVNLRGQLSLKQSECLLPSVAGKCIYHIGVTRGRIRFIHRSYNPETKEWDLPPENGQKEICDISQGESVDIPVEVASSTKKADRLRVVNRGMKTEAVFDYKISSETDGGQE